MLDLMRRHARSWLIKAALGGIIIVFVFWYGWSGPPAEDPYVVAEVNGVTIPYDYFRTIYESQVEQLRMRFGGSIPEGFLERMNLKKTVAHSLVSQLLMIQEAKRLGLFVTDEDVVESIRNDPLFQRNGTFQPAIYQTYLRKVRLSPSVFEQLRREQLLQEQLGRLFVDGVKTDPAELRRLWHFQNDKLVLAITLLTPDKDSVPKDVDEKDLQAYFERHQETYKIPASVDVNYVAFSWKDVADDVSVTEEEISTYYQSHLKEFSEPEKVKAKHIFLRTPPELSSEEVAAKEKKIEELRKRIEAGESFEDVAKEASEDRVTAPKGGDLGYISPGSLNPKLEEAAFDLEPGSVSKPIQTKQGFYLIKVEDVRPARQRTLDEVKDEIRAQLTQRRARRNVADVADAFYEQAYRTETLEDPAKEFGLETKTAQDVMREVGIPGVGKAPEIMDEAFARNVGEISRLMRQDDTFVLMKVLDKTESRIPELHEVRSTVIADYRRHEALEKTKEKAREIIEALRTEDTQPEQVAKEFGVTWNTLGAVSRTAPLVPMLGNSPEVKEMLTAISVAEPVYSEPIETKDGVAVVRLDKVKRADKEQYEKEKAEFKEWIIEVRRTEFLKGWIDSLREKSQVAVHDRRL